MVSCGLGEHRIMTLVRRSASQRRIRPASQTLAISEVILCARDRLPRSISVDHATSGGLRTGLGVRATNAVGATGHVGAIGCA